MAEMKVYGWTAMAVGRHVGMGRQLRCIVACKSFAAASRASEAAGLGRIHRDYCSTTGNGRELEAANAQPGVVLLRGLDDYHGDYEAAQPQREETKR